MEPSWKVQAKSARVKLMSGLGGGRVSASVDYTDGDVDVHEVAYERDLEDGRSVTATLQPKTQNLEVDGRTHTTHIRKRPPQTQNTTHTPHTHASDHTHSTHTHITPSFTTPYSSSTPHQPTSAPHRSQVEYKDDKFEQGASWTATANVPLSDANNILDASKVTVLRAWKW